MRPVSTRRCLGQELRGVPSLMNDRSVEGRALPRVVQRLIWLRRHRRQVLLLTFLGIATAFLLDLLIPGYAIAGFYLLPLLLVAFAVDERLIVAVVGVLCMGLAVFTMVLQGRSNGQNILLLGFGALAGVGLVALGYLCPALRPPLRDGTIHDGQAALPHRTVAEAAGGVGTRLGPAAVGPARSHRPAGTAAARQRRRRALSVRRRRRSPQTRGCGRRLSRYDRGAVAAHQGGSCRKGRT